MRELILSTLTFTLIIPAMAQNRSIAGYVFDIADGAAVEGATVVVSQPDSTLPPSVAVTDCNGAFQIDNCPENFTLQVSHLSYVRHNEELSANDLTNGILHIGVERRVHSIEEITIVAENTRFVRESGGAFAMENVYLSSLAKGRSGKGFLDFIPLLKVSEESGVSILNRQSSEIRINGKSIGSGTQALTILNAIPAESIRRIEIIPVAGSSESASSKNGIVNFVLLKRPDEGVKATVGLSSEQSRYNSQGARVYLSYSRKKIDLTGIFTLDNSRYYHRFKSEYIYTSEGVSQRLDYTQRSKQLGVKGYLHLDYNINEKHTVGTRFGIGSIKYNETVNSTTDFITIGNGVDSTYYQSTKVNSPGDIMPVSANLNHTFKMGDNDKLETDIFYSYIPYDQTSHSLYQKNNAGVITDVSGFIQRNYYSSNHYTVKTKYNHLFENGSGLEAGLYFSYGKRQDNFLYANNIGGEYISDPERSNRFDFDDYLFAAYAEYDCEWSDKFMTTFGIRAEKYIATGIQRVNGNKVRRNEFGVFPNFSLTYTASDNHEFSLDFGTSISRPHYSMLNPFERELAPTLYVKNNPNLKSSRNYNIFFNYNLFTDFDLSVDYNFDKDSWSDFILTDGNGKTQQITANYGDAHGVDFSLQYIKRLFNRHWHIALSFDVYYSKESGQVNDISMHSEDWSYSMKINNNIVLSKKRGISMFLAYKYSSDAQNISFASEASHKLDISVMKNFKNSSLSVSANNLLNRTSKIHSKTSDFIMTRKLYNTPSFSVSYTYTFGNVKVRQLQNRDNSELENRM